MSDQDFPSDDLPRQKEEEGEGPIERRRSGRYRTTILGHRLNVDEILCVSPLEEPVYRSYTGRPPKSSLPSPRKSAHKRTQRTPRGDPPRNKLSGPSACTFAPKRARGRPPSNKGGAYIGTISASVRKHTSQTLDPDLESSTKGTSGGFNLHEATPVAIVQHYEQENTYNPFKESQGAHPTACNFAQKRPPDRPYKNKHADAWISSASNRNNTNQTSDGMESSTGTSGGLNLNQIPQYSEKENSYTDYQSFAPSLLRMAADFNETEEEDSGENDGMLQVGSYRVSSKVSHTLQTILNKQGDIGKHCELESSDLKLSAALESICNVVQEIQTTKVSDLSCKHLDAFNSMLTDAENLKLDVKWLRDQLEQIPQLVWLVNRYKELRDKNGRTLLVVNDFKKSLEMKKAENEEIQAAIRDLEGRVESEMQKSKKLKMDMNDTISRCKQIRSTCLKDGKLKIFS